MINITQLSYEVGIGVDTLRIWERRYRFPNPERDRRGHRRYPDEQVEELRVIKQLQVIGYRPGKIFALPSSERRKLLSLEQGSSGVDNETLLHLATELAPKEIESELRRQLQQLGLQEFIYQIGVPLLEVLGRGWENKSISIGREHLVSDRLEALLKEQLKIVEAGLSQPTILFLTLSGEQHRLGLLMAALLFQQQGIGCIFLNEAMPLSEISGLAVELGVDAVAVSFSAHFLSRRAKVDLASLRKALPASIKLIAGGGAIRKEFEIDNLFICLDLEKIPDLSVRLFPEKIRREDDVSG